MGSQAAEAVPELADALQDEDGPLREAVIDALGQIGPEARDAIPALLKAISDSDRKLLDKASEVLRKIGPLTRTHLPQLLLALKHERLAVRVFALEAIGELGESATAARPAILEYLREEADPEAIAPVIRVLGKVSPTAASDASLLASLIKSKTAAARIFAAERLVAIGGEARPATVALTEALRDNDPAVKKAAVIALGNIGPEAAIARPALNALLLRAPEAEMRRTVAEALFKIGPDISTLAAWIKALRDEDGVVSSTAMKVLAGSDSLRNEHAPALIDLLKSDKRALRQQAALLLGNMKVADKAVVSALADALRDSEKPVRMEAARALGKLGSSAWSAAGSLAEALKDKEPEVRKTAMTSLGEIGPDAWGAVPVLIASLKNAELHDGAVATLVKVGKGAVSDLLRSLVNSRDTKDRVELITILRRIGPDAKDALPALKKIGSDDNIASVRKAANDAVLQIERRGK